MESILDFQLIYHITVLPGTFCTRYVSILYHNENDKSIENQEFIRLVFKKTFNAVRACTYIMHVTYTLLTSVRYRYQLDGTKLTGYMVLERSKEITPEALSAMRASSRSIPGACTSR